MNPDGNDTWADALTNAELIDCISRRLGGGADTATLYGAYRTQLASERFVVPLFGVQGAGKSTLLNALLFDDLVLPVDADETTSVPVEVVRAEGGSQRATVRFKDGSSKEVPVTEQGLAEYVHQAKNAGNRLGVERIVLETTSPLLARGLVLVDLPGTGSLTPENVATTDAYLSESLGVVFLLRTVPPLTKSEAIQVANAWRRIPTAVFVQNRWTDESTEEAAAGREHNVRVLVELAKQHAIRTDGGLAVHVVNAYDALCARLDRTDGASSGIAPLESALTALGDGWPDVVRGRIRAQVGQDIVAARETIGRMRKAGSAERGEAEADIAEAQERFRKYFEDLQARRQTAGRDIERVTSGLRDRTTAWDRQARSTLRNRMRTKMRGGIVDGPRLATALKDEQTAQLEDLLFDVQVGLTGCADDVKQRFDDAVPWSFSTFDTSRGVSVEEARKLEGLLPKFGSAAGAACAGIGLGWGGKVVGGVVGSAFGPAGTLVGAMVGGVAGTVLGGLLGAIVGKKAGNAAHDAVTRSRAEDAEPIVFGAIDRFCRDTVQALLSQVGEFEKAVGDVLDRWLDAQRKTYEHDRDQQLATLEMTADEKRSLLAALETEEAILARWAERVQPRRGA